MKNATIKPVALGLFLAAGATSLHAQSKYLNAQNDGYNNIYAPQVPFW